MDAERFMVEPSPRCPGFTLTSETWGAFHEHQNAPKQISASFLQMIT